MFTTIIRDYGALVGSMVRSAASKKEDRGSNPTGDTSGEVGSYLLISPILMISMTVVANASGFERKQSYTPTIAH